MYIVELHNGSISIPIHNSKEKLTSGKVTKGINTIDSFQFSMLPSSAGFYEVYDYTTLVTVYNTNRRRYEFFGRVLYSEDTMNESGEIKKEVICESFLGFLCDSQQEYVAERNWRVGELLEHIINTHNSQMESFKQFTIGEVTVTDPNDNIYCGIQRENTWETLNRKLIEVLGGEIRFRVDRDVIYLDYLTEIGGKSSTEIALSKNMKAISREKDPSEIVTRLIPLGCKRTAVDEEGNEVETEYRLDISAVNDGKNYIDDELAIQIYGIKVKTVEFDDVTVASTLMKRGEDWLINNNKIQVSYTITALDLSLIGKDVDDFEVCNYYRVKNHLLGIDDDVRVIKKSIDICNEVNSTLEFGDNFETLTEAMKRKTDALNLITANYVTNLRFTNAITKTSTLIEQTEEKIRLEMTAEYEDLKQTTAEIKLDVNGIQSSVTETQADVTALDGRVTTAESKITQTAESITAEVNKKVGYDELGTKIVQNYESVQIAWNNISNYISFADGKMNIFKSKAQGADNLLCSMGSGGVRYYYKGADLGKIGTNHLNDDEACRGLVFDLETAAQYMAWARLDNETDESYSVKLMYRAADDFIEEGIYLGCSLFLSDDVRTIQYESGAGLYSEYDPISIQCGDGGGMFECGYIFTFTTNGAQLIDCYNNINMNGYSLMNTSDARLKRNIQPTTVDALSVISQIDMMQFDWIESGEHCDLGMIAQQVREIAPYLVNEDKDTGKLSLKIDKFIPYLMKAVQELSEKVNGGNTRAKRKWADPFTEEEKSKFVTANAPKSKKQKTAAKQFKIPVTKRS